MGKLIWLYGVFNTIGMLMILIYNLLHYKEKKKLLGGVSRSALARFSSKQCRGPWKSAAFWVVLETVLISLAQHTLAVCFNTPFGKLFHTGANYFGMLFSAPILVALVCKLLKMDYLAHYDMITPAYPLALFFTKIACFSAGCCRGFAWEYGFYNPVTNLTEFPAQLLEAVTVLILFVFLHKCRGKLKKGTVFPVYLITYSATRFFTEFTRCEPRTFHGLKTYQVLCIAGVLVGLLEYFLVCRYNGCSKGKEETQEYNHFDT